MTSKKLHVFTDAAHGPLTSPERTVSEDVWSDVSSESSSWRRVTHVTWWRYWAAQGGWAVLDQALFTASNFIVSILLARWLSPSDYGAFVGSYASLLLFSVIHTGIVTEPLLVFGSGRYAQRFAPYLRIVIRQHMRLTGMAVLVLTVAGIALVAVGKPILGWGLAGMGVATPAVLLAWLARRMHYAQSKPAAAARVSAIYLALTLAGLWALYATSLLSVFGGQMLLAVASLAASIGALKRESRALGPLTVPAPTNQVQTEHWDYGKWIVATGALQWVHLHGWTLIMVPITGVEGSAVLRAVLNLVLPVVHLNIAIGGLLVPIFVRGRESAARFRSLLLITGVMSVGPATLYGLAVLIWGAVAIDVLYAGAYTASSAVLVLLALLPFFFGVGNVLDPALMALEQPERLFRSSVAAAIVAVPFGLWAIGRWGVAGVLMAMVCAAAIQAAVNAWSLRAVIPRETDSSSMPTPMARQADAQISEHVTDTNPVS